MPYLGTKGLKASDIRRFNVTGSTSATHTLTWVAPTEQSLIVTINGVKQQEDAYSVSGTTLTLTSALIATDKMEVVGINDVGTTVTPAQNSVNLDKLATTGTASSSTFLRGDMAWTAVSDVSGFNSIQVFTSSGTWTRPSGITKVKIHVIGGGAGGGGGRTSYNYAGGGGGAGGNLLKVLDVSSISSATITVGSGGTGGAVNADGGNGGTSTWVDGTNTLTANGGSGVLALGGNSTVMAGGTATGGDINASGGAGSTSGTTTANPGSSGLGGLSGSGFGGTGGSNFANPSGLNDATGYGHGGTGGPINHAGGDGAGGLIWVEEYK